MKTILAIAKKSWGFITGNVRLVIEYTLIGVIVALCGFTAALWASKRNTERSLASTQESLGSVMTSLTSTIGTVRQNINTLEAINALRKKDAEALTLLTGNLAALAEKDFAVRSRLQQLEASNEVVKKYMDTDVPLELVCLLDDACQEGSSDSPGSENVPHRDK